ncbi:hypothetical protein FRZ03_21240 [Streptomyces misionensis]|uniref:Uncharacterized protein n=1 Tax=Streptomyces misionensis TaxID=67331 RepID=A0A5C6JJ43_9ACTN|nr:hypothetical protein [Streptomyces misionensis]TWV41357.1 hypothetical protein FRZ03_21240 [Streptomyces misionensis]
MEITVQLARHHRADLRARAAAHHAATALNPPTALRTRVGWSLVELGLRLATTPRPTAPAFAR